MSFNTRIRERREQLNMTRNELAAKIGVTPSAISNYENAISSPKVELLYKLFEVLDCDANYLYQDEMSELAYKNKTTPEEFDNIIKKYRALNDHGKEIVDLILEKEYQNSKIKEINPTTTRLVNYYYKLASAGTGQIIFDSPPTSSIEIPDTYKNVDYAIGVNGDSMEPVYSDGDTLLVQMTNDIEIGDIGIFQIDGQCYVKKLGEGELISVNQKYDNIPLNESASCMGKVVYKL